MVFHGPVPQAFVPAGHFGILARVEVLGATPEVRVGEQEDLNGGFIIRTLDDFEGAHLAIHTVLRKAGRGGDQGMFFTLEILFGPDVHDQGQIDIQLCRDAQFTDLDVSELDFCPLSIQSESACIEVGAYQPTLHFRI